MEQARLRPAAEVEGKTHLDAPHQTSQTCSSDVNLTITEKTIR